MEDLYKTIIQALATLLIGSCLSLLGAWLSGVILGKITAKTASQTDDYIVKSLTKTIKPLGLIITATLAWKLLPIQEDFNYIVLGISKLFILLILVRLINRIILRVIQRWSYRISDEAVSSMLESLSPMARATTWSVGIVFYLQNMGVQMAAIWALLSAGGIGAGLALKEPVQEFFEYITILLDKPFQNGQFIHAEGIWATVERVGVRSTRLRSLNGEIIIMSNSALTNGIISNYTEMKYRRLVHKLGVVYDTPLTKMKEIPQIIESIISNTEDAKFDRCHFVQFNNSSLDFELVYFIPTNDYLRAMSAQQSINLEIIRSFKEKNIEFAFPTRTIQIQQN